MLYERLLNQELSAIILLISRQILLLALILAAHQIPKTPKMTNDQFPMTTECLNDQMTNNDTSRFIGH